jgi:hypothetical protein
MSPEMLARLFETNAPKDPIAYGRSIRRMINKTIETEDFVICPQNLESFADRLYDEIRRVAGMPNGRRTILELLLDLAVDVLPLDNKRSDAQFRICAATSKRIFPELSQRLERHQKSACMILR